MHLTKSQNRALVVATIISVFIAGLLVFQFFSAVVAAAIAAFLFYPVYVWLGKKTKSNNTAVTLTLLISMFAIILPIVGILIISFNQVQTMLSDLETLAQNQDPTTSADGLIVGINDLLGKISDGRLSISTEQIRDAVLSIAEDFAQGVLNFLTSVIGNIPSFITNIIIFLYVFAALLAHNTKLTTIIKKLNPLGEEVSTLYLDRAGKMTKAMVVAQFSIAIIQGTVGALSLSIAGLPYFAFFALILSALSIIPLGGGIITIPIGIILLLTGNIWQGLLVLLTHFVVVTNIDNILKPMFMNESVRLNPALTIISVLAGVALFGFFGLIIGPVLLILAITTIEIYLKVYGKNAKA